MSPGILRNDVKHQGGRRRESINSLLEGISSSSQGRARVIYSRILKSNEILYYRNEAEYTRDGYTRYKSLIHCLVGGRRVWRWHTWRVMRRRSRARAECSASSVIRNHSKKTKENLYSRDIDADGSFPFSSRDRGETILPPSCTAHACNTQQLDIIRERK